jgi:general nucleoside transport system ATP-binding protein
VTGSRPGAPPAALELRGITKHYGSVAAVQDVDLVIRRGSVHALLGENGAGKTTLMRIVYGLAAADAGGIRIFGRAVPANHSVREAMRAGVGMVHQHLSLVGNLTAAENLALGGRGAFRPLDAVASLADLSEKLGLSVRPDVLARDLSIVEQQRLEILKALGRGARLLVLDEPTAVLAPPEIRDLLDWTRGFAAGGGTVVLITHKLREALAVADEVTVLRRGRVTHQGAAAGATEDELRRAIFVDAPEPERTAASAPGELVVHARNVSLRDARGALRISDAEFDIRQGEIVGIAGVEGSGHRELIAALSARHTITSGTLDLPQDVSLIPADRIRDAIIAGFSLTENVALRAAGARRALMPWAALRQRTAALVQRFDIATPSVATRARALSGGNQQRLVVARELEQRPTLLVADNPTRGLDQRATGFVHEQLKRAAAEGAAVVVHTSDMDELLGLATRILVVFDGTVREVSGGRDVVGRAMIGAA